MGVRRRDRTARREKSPTGGMTAGQGKGEQKPPPTASGCAAGALMRNAEETAVTVRYTFSHLANRCSPKTAPIPTAAHIALRCRLVNTSQLWSRA